MRLDQLKQRKFITLIGGAVSLFLCVSAAAQEGYYGVGHDKWHQVLGRGSRFDAPLGTPAYGGGVYS
jgi:hypothetical protein